MTTRPITFSTEMIHALMAGRKHMTRRLVKFPERWAHDCHMRDPMDSKPTDPPWPCVLGGDGRYHKLPCPYGDVGQLLRVREAAWMWCEKVADGLTPKGRPKFRYVPVEGAAIYYKADRAEKPWGIGGKIDFREGRAFCWRLKIPRFLPSWASRTTLKVESIRVERLQEITHRDALAEGVEYDVGQPDGAPVPRFQKLWTRIHDRDSWEANPWVWVVGFSKI